MLRKQFATTLAISAALAASRVCLAAPVDEALRYPWDKRAVACVAPENLSSPECFANDWPTVRVARTRIELLYKVEQFALLERALSEIAALDSRDKRGIPLATAIYSAISALAPSDAALYRPEEFLRASRWRAAAPQSKYAPILEATLTRAKAWNIRGNGTADTVSAASWELFRKYNRDAEALLLAMPEGLQETVTWHYALLVIANDLDDPQRVPHKIFEDAMAKWPDYYPLYNVTAFRMLPKWGGSWQAIEKFADRWAEKNFAKDGGALYARVYLYLRHQASFREMAPDWPKLKRGFMRLIRNHPEEEFRNNFASFACAAGDKEQFISVMREIPQSRIQATAWLQGHTHAACTEWAYAKL